MPRVFYLTLFFSLINIKIISCSVHYIIMNSLDEFFSELQIFGAALISSVDKV